jgi:hypothetical protein
VESLRVYTIFLNLFKLALPGSVLLIGLPKDPKAKDRAKAPDSAASQAGPSCHGLLVIAPYYIVFVWRRFFSMYSVSLGIVES